MAQHARMRRDIPELPKVPTGTIAYTLDPNVMIGQHGNGGGSYFHGTLDSVRFYANVPPTQDGVENDCLEQVPQGGLAMTHTQFGPANVAEHLSFFKAWIPIFRTPSRSP